MITPHIKIWMIAALLVLFLGIASTDILLNKLRRTRTLPYNCVEAVRSAGAEAKSGIYQIRLPLVGWAHRPFYVYCLLDGNGGDPWLLVQRRQDGGIKFNRNWIDYKSGFGNMETSFFIGFDILHAITQVQINELQIELHDFNDTVKYANYESFAVGDENEKYALNMLGPYSGSAGDGLLYYNSGQKFTTYDVDNDGNYWNCAVKYQGAWWYDNCHHSCLHGEYLDYTNKAEGKGIIWSTWHGVYYSLKYTHMAIRPKDSSEIRVNGCRRRRPKICKTGKDGEKPDKGKDGEKPEKGTDTDNKRKKCKKWLKEQRCKKWLKEQRCKKWLKEQRCKKWLKVQRCKKWLKEQRCKKWLKEQRCKKRLYKEKNCKKWLKEQRCKKRINKAKNGMKELKKHRSKKGIKKEIDCTKWLKEWRCKKRINKEKECKKWLNA